jgi:predicted PurR-regulated permease PerM
VTGRVTRNSWPGAVFWLGGLVVIGVMLYLVSGVLLPFAAGFGIAYLLNPLCDRLETMGLPRALASLVVLLGFLLAFALVFLILVPLVESQIIELAGRIPLFLDAARRELNLLMAVVQERLSPEDFARLRDAVGGRLGDAFSWGGRLLTGLLTGGLAFFNILSLVFITPIVAFFILRDWHRLIAAIDRFLPRRHAATIRGQALLVDATLAGFIRGQAMVCLVMGVFYALALSIVGLEFGLVLGLLVGVLLIIPFLGAAVGGILAVVLAIMQFTDWTRVGIVAGIFLVGQTIEGNILTPRLVGGRVNLHPVWVIFALLAFGSLFGLLGLMIAVPVAAIIGVLTRFALQRYLAGPLYDPRGDDPAGTDVAPTASGAIDIVRDDEPACL